jgi:hypothetical protein
MQKFLAPNSKPNKDTFPELPDVVIWFRFILAVSYGTWLGLGTEQGGSAVLMALNFVTFVPILYCSTFLGADNESYGTKIFFGGVANSMALLMLIWIYFYTMRHEEDEAKISEAIISLLNITGSDGASGELPFVESGAAVADAEF